MSGGGQGAAPETAFLTEIEADSMTEIDIGAGGPCAYSLLLLLQLCSLLESALDVLLCVSRSPPPRYGRDMGPPRYRSPVRSRRPAPTTGLHLFAAGLNFIINERVRHILGIFCVATSSTYIFAMFCKSDAPVCYTAGFGKKV